MELKKFITADEIKKLNEKLGKQISDDYSKVLAKEEELLFIVTLRGALFFAADVMREVTVPLTVDFVRLASYGNATKSSGTVRIEKDVETSPEGRHVIILDEIVDSGRTLNFLHGRLKAQKPKSMKICALLSKPSRREVEVSIDYLGREVEDKFLVGYGLDYQEHYRNLKDIFYVPS